MFNKMKDSLFPTMEDIEELRDKVSQIKREDVARLGVLILGIYFMFIVINPLMALAAGLIVFAHVGAVVSIAFVLHRTYLFICGKKPKNFYWNKYELDDYIFSILIPGILVFPLCVFLLHIIYGA